MSYCKLSLVLWCLSSNHQSESLAVVLAAGTHRSSNTSLVENHPQRAINHVGNHVSLWSLWPTGAKTNYVTYVPLYLEFSSSTSYCSNKRLDRTRNETTKAVNKYSYVSIENKIEQDTSLGTSPRCSTVINSVMLASFIADYRKRRDCESFLKMIYASTIAELVRNIKRLKWTPFPTKLLSIHFITILNITSI